jgi:acetylornithine deacetylase/succinyl-diaminopimelate desuccinylase-like protein
LSQFPKIWGAPAEQLDRMDSALLKLAERIGSEHHLSLYMEPEESCPTAPMHEQLIEIVEQVASQLGLKSTRLISFAGHDAQILAAVVPKALFFVPSPGGISHTPGEFTHDNDVINGANVLLRTLLRLATNTR